MKCVAFVAVYCYSCGYSVFADHTVTVKVDNADLCDCIAAVDQIFCELLDFQPNLEPSAKRPCYGNEIARQDYDVKSRTWEGRRNKRRQLGNEFSNIDAWTLEKKVERDLRSGSITEVLQLFLD